MKAIIFGSNGQDGFYLNQLLSQNGLFVINVSRKNAAICGNVANYSFVENLIKEEQPEFIFHLAANSSTNHNLLFENHATIETGTLNILESVKLHSPSSKVFISGSALQFKNCGLPINEQTVFEASSPYALARIQSTYAARYYRNAFGVKAYIGYFFNHDSPLRTEQHVNKKIVKAVQRIATGNQEKLILGNIDVKKEFNFAGDLVEAIWQFVKQDKIFELVIGSGEAFSIKKWVETCFSLKGMNFENYLSIQNNFIPQYDILVSDPSLLRSIGWEPKTDFYQLAKMMMINE